VLNKILVALVEEFGARKVAAALSAAMVITATPEHIRDVSRAARRYLAYNPRCPMRLARIKMAHKLVPGLVLLSDAKTWVDNVFV